jgi:hypothetical protein
MNPLVAYAKVPMSFLNLYRRRDSRGKYLLAIACAMTGILIVNVWSGLLIAVCVTHTSLVGTRIIEAGTYSSILRGFSFLNWHSFIFGATKGLPRPELCEASRRHEPKDLDMVCARVRWFACGVNLGDDAHYMMRTARKQPNERSL